LQVTCKPPSKGKAEYVQAVVVDHHVHWGWLDARGGLKEWRNLGEAPESGRTGLRCTEASTLVFIPVRVARAYPVVA
jgi:hypothetical protein